MNRPVYAAYDKVALIYAPIWPSNNDNTAIREFGMQFGSGSIPITDFQLFCIGMYDADSGVLTSSPLRFVVDGNEFKKGASE